MTSRAYFTQRSEIRDLEEQLFRNSQFQGIVGKSPAMLEVFDLARKVARHYTNVLITGPTGAAKSLSRAPCTNSAPLPSRNSPSATARRLSTRCSKASFLGTSAALSQAPPTHGPVCSNMPMGEPFFWTKLAKHRCRCRPSCCA